mgnify:CR=1 FL=1|jgi:hypothetical protein
MRFDWKPESKERYFRKAEAAVKAAGFDDILRVDRDQFSVVKGTVKVHFKPISRDGKTRRWWEAKRTIEKNRVHTAVQAATVHMDVQGQGLQTHLFVLRIL